MQTNKKEPIVIIAAICSIGRKGLLTRAVKSILEQKKKPEKLIISFDKNVDPEEHRSEILKLNRKRKCDIEIIQNTHREGLAGNWNTILNHLLDNHAINPSTTFVAFLDDDDYWSEDYLLKCVAALREGKDVTASRIKRIQHADSVIDKQPPETLDIDLFLIGGAAIQLSNLIVRLSVLDAIGMFDEGLITNHDRDVCIRLAEGGYSYEAILDTEIYHDTSHGLLRMSLPSNPLKQTGIRLFFEKWAAAMSADVLRRSLSYSAHFFNYQKDFTRAKLLIGTICTTQQGLDRFLLQFEEIDLPNFDCRIVIFANFQEAKDCEIKTSFGHVNVFTISKLSNPFSISKARNVLHYRILKQCRDEDTDPLIWLLDEDIIITKSATAKLPHCWALKTSKRYDVLIGTLSGESPNSALFGLRGELSDFKNNFKWLDDLKCSDTPPNRSLMNQDYVTRNPEYYYDLDSKTHSEFCTNESVIWMEPESVTQTVKESRDLLIQGLKHISQGGRFFRSLRERQEAPVWKHLQPSLHRGPNCFILNIDALRIPNPQIKFNGHYLRRSDMMWSLTASKYFGFKIVEVAVPVLHRERQGKTEELEVEKNNAEFIGSVVFNALKQSGNIMDDEAFFLTLKDVAGKRLMMIKRNIQGIRQLLLHLVQMPNEEIGIYIRKLQKTMECFDSDWLRFLEELLLNLKFASSVLEQYRSSIMQRVIIHSISNNIETDDGTFTLHTSECGLIKMLIHNDPWQNKNPLVRVHSSCTHSEIFGARDCDCDNQLQSAKELITHHGAGVIFYIEQEGRGHGFITKLKIVDTMEKHGITTYEACDHLRIAEDKRNYNHIIQLMHDTGLESYTILTNNAKKFQTFREEFNVKRRTILGDFNDENRLYLVSKNENTHSEPFATASVLDAIKFDGQAQPITFYETNDVYGFLSNFDRKAIYREGKMWPTAEHAYQAQKFLDADLRENIRQELEPTLAKVLAYKHQQEIRADWDEIKIPVMCAILKAKIFQHKDLKEQLVATGHAEIIELTETDAFWGRGSSGIGENYLGKAWMFIRRYYSGA